MRQNTTSFVGLLLFFFSRISLASAYDIPLCIEGNISYHVHPQVVVIEFVVSQKDNRAIDTVQIHPPTNLGLSEKNSGTDSCDREIHTHGAIPDGGHPDLLHTESTDPSRTHYLGEFLVLWSSVNPDLVQRIVQDGIVLVSSASQQLMLVPRQQIVDIPLQDDKKIIIILPTNASPKDQRATISLP